MLSDAKEICAAVKRVSPDTLTVLDGVCSVGSEEIRMDEWGVDVVSVSTRNNPAVLLLQPVDLSSGPAGLGRFPEGSRRPSWTLCRLCLAESPLRLQGPQGPTHILLRLVGKVAAHHGSL